MQIDVHSIHFDADVKLIDFIKERMKKLDQYHENIIAGEVILKLDKSDDRENKVTEVKLFVPGKDHFAKKQCKTFEESTDQCIDALIRQIKKAKGKDKLRSTQE